MKYNEYPLNITVNSRSIARIRIGRHYELKHGSYMNDELILELVTALDGENFKQDSASNGISYFAADVIHHSEIGGKRIFRLIWIFEGDYLEILGVINAYRRRTKKKV